MSDDEVERLTKATGAAEATPENSVVWQLVQKLFPSSTSEEVTQLVQDYTTVETKSDVDDELLRDPSMSELLEELVLHDRENYDEVKTMNLRLRTARHRALEILRRSGAVILKKERAAVARRKLGDKKVWGKKKPTTNVSKATAVNVKQIQHVTPQFVTKLEPEGFRIRLDVPGVRWKVHIDSPGQQDKNHVKQFGFGPRSKRNRLQAFEAALDWSWETSSKERPSSAVLAAISEAERESVFRRGR